MLYLFEPPEAVSFTDEASGKNKEKTSRRIWIHAQIGRHLTLDWFEELRAFYPEIQGEFKSFRIEDTYQKLSRELKLRVSAGIKKARIHVVDTFAYEARLKQILREAYKCDNYEKRLRESDNKELEKTVIRWREDRIAEQILIDSPAQRIEQRLEARRMVGLGYSGYPALYNRDCNGRQLSIDLTPFQKDKKRIYDTAAKWVSKSNAVFSDAAEFVNNGFGGGEYETRQRVAEMLNVSHAFDDGDNLSIKWLEDQRKHFDSVFSYQIFDNGNQSGGKVERDIIYQNPSRANKLYGNIKSQLSKRMQAADVAAGIARSYYDDHGLTVIAEKFEYVTFNGKKVTEKNIGHTLEFWKTIQEREKKIQKFISDL